MPSPIRSNSATGIYVTESWNGIYYQSDNPTISVTNVVYGNTNTVPMGCNSWIVLNDEGVQVASGTTTPDQTSVTVATNGVWSSGGTVEIGGYQFYSDTSPAAVSGGGVSQWNMLVNPAGELGYDLSIWWGIIDQVGTFTTYMSVAGTELTNVASLEFSSANGSSTTWTAIEGNYTPVSTASTVATFPTFTTTAAGDLYIGRIASNESLVAGTTSGFVWNPSTVNNGNGLIYNTDCPLGTVAPVGSFSTAAEYCVEAGLFSAGGAAISYVGAYTGGINYTGNEQFSWPVTTTAVGNLAVVVYNQLNTGANIPTTPVGLYPQPIPEGCAFYVCPPTRMFNPVAEGYLAPTSNSDAYQLCAWMGVAQSRGSYQDANTASTIATTYASDACFNGAWLDPARPYIPWMASSQQVAVAPWSTTVPAMVSAGLTGWTYELPGNEPESVPGYTGISEIITDYNTARSEVLAADPTAKCIAFCSAGIPDDTNFANALDVLNSITGFDYISQHDESSNMNQPILSLLKEKWNGLKAMAVASPTPDAIVWSTETGMLATYYTTYHPRRHGAQVTKFLLARESVGYRKEFAYFFRTGLSNVQGWPAGFLEAQSIGGSIHFGGYAAHVMSEALYGTLCSPASPPPSLDFGPPGSVGDSLFMGLHYTAPSLSRDVIVLATSGMGKDNNETVILKLSSMTNVYVWNGAGRDITSQCTINGDEITVPVDDLLTYVFASEGVTVSVVDTGSKVLSVLNNQTNILPFVRGLQLTNGNRFNISTLAWTNYNAYIPNEIGTGSPVAFPGPITTPLTVTSDTFPNTLPITGFTFQAPFPWWAGNSVGIPFSSTLLAFDFEVLVSGTWTTVYSYTNSSATSVAAPLALSEDTIIRTTYWDHAFSWAATFSPVLGDAVRLNINSLSYSGDVDLACWEIEPFATVPTSLNFVQFQVFWDQSMKATPPSISTAMKLSGA